MKIAFIVGMICCFPSPFWAQDWKQVHHADEVKWAKETRLDPGTIHKLWRQASHFADEKEDDSRIADIDLEGLAEHRHALFVTYAGENNCLTLTIFRRLSETSFSKLMAIEQSTEGQGFCDSRFGSARAQVNNGIVEVGVPHAPSSDSPGRIEYTVYSYEWNGITYRQTGKREMEGRP